MSDKKLDLGPHIWFIVHHDGPVVTGVQEHDFREGGHLTLPKTMTWEQLFLRNVASRLKEGVQSPYYAKAQTLLEEISKCK